MKYLYAHNSVVAWPRGCGLGGSSALIHIPGRDADYDA